MEALAIAMERLLWRHRAESWDEEGSAQLAPVVDAVLASSKPSAGSLAVDLGAGSGQVTLPLARECSHVLAVDVSGRAIALLERRATRERAMNIRTLTNPIETLELPPGSVDIVVSNYALHHLRDRDKRAVVARVFGWLRPGGRLVIGDMMFGRGTTREDREIIAAKVRSLAARGLAGWWRILKNAWRFMLRFQEKPLPAEAWIAIASDAGFEDVDAHPVVAEAWVMSAVKPEREVAE